MTPTKPGTDSPWRSPAATAHRVIAQLQQWCERTHHRTILGVVWLLLSRFILLLVVLQGYSWFRKTYFQRQEERAYANAMDVIDLQRRLGFAVADVEIPLQQWVLDHPVLIDFFNAYYRQFKPALYVCVLVCLLLAPAAFRRVNHIFLIATLIAFPCYALYPLAPPRLMEPFGFDFVDTLAVYGGVQSSSAGAGGANQFAAMPSMHVGWTSIAALWLAAAIPWHRVGAIVGSIHLTIMCITVVVTGNHYVLDIVGGFIVVGSAMLVARALPAGLAFPRSPRILARTAFRRPTNLTQ